MEEWRDIVGYEGYYKISSLGNIKRLTKKGERLVKSTDRGQGYYRVNLSKNNIKRTTNIHRMVAEAFLERDSNKDQVNHINGIKHDNRVENLEWCTLTENRQHAFRTGLQKGKKGCENSHSKLVNKDIYDIIKLSKFFSQRELGFIFGVSQSHISNIVNKKLWKHI